MLTHAAAPPPTLHGGGGGGDASSSPRRPGLLLLLHGSGDDEHGLLPLGAAVAPPGFQVASLRAPLPRGWGGYAWFEGMSAAPEPPALESTLGSSCDAVFNFIEHAPQLLGTDPSRVWLLGFSQGATVAWTALLSRWARAGMIAGAAALSGRLMPELMQPHTPLGGRLAPAAQLRGVSVFASHGGQDQVTPCAIGAQNHAAFTQHLQQLPVAAALGAGGGAAAGAAAGGGGGGGGVL
eukprot:COSAG01_NODE_20857_length_931_cov_1.765625_1_plen_236_part_01